jgi:serine/threonine protein kinase
MSLHGLLSATSEDSLFSKHHQTLSKDYEIKEKLGNGICGVVYRATKRTERDDVALKIFQTRRYYTRERDIYQKLVGVPYVMETMGFRDDANTIILPYYSGGNLYNAYSSNRAYWIGNLPAIRNIAIQTTYGLCGIHQRSLVHCDLKPENIIFTDPTQVQIRIGDLGSAYQVGLSTFNYACSPWYRPPEDFIGAPIDGTFDTWSMGCCLSELYTGDPLFPGSTQNYDRETLDLIMRRQGPIPWHMLMSGNRTKTYFDFKYQFIGGRSASLLPVPRYIKNRGMLYHHDPVAVSYFSDFIGRCLAVDTSRRMTALQAYYHPFLTETNVLSLEVPTTTQLGQDREYFSLFDATTNRAIATFNLFEIQANGGFCSFLSHCPLNNEYFACINSSNGQPVSLLDLSLHQDAVLTITDDGVITCCEKEDSFSESPPVIQLVAEK